MGASNSTSTLDLPLFADGDKPSWRGDVNGISNKVEAAHVALTARVANNEAQFDHNTGQNISKTGAGTPTETQTAGDSRWIRSAALGISQVVNPTHATLQAALAAGDGLRVTTAGAYSTDQTLTITDECDLTMLTITYTGVSECYRVGASNAQTFRKRFRLPKIINGNKTLNGWGAQAVGANTVAGSIGATFVNLYSCTVDVPYIKNFEIGMRTVGASSNGCQQNTFNLGHLDNNKINLDFDALDATGWTNQNTFIGGRLSHNSNEGVQVVGTRHVRMKALANVVNGHVFVGTSMESPDVVEYHIEANNTIYNLLLNCRFENPGGNTHRRIMVTGTSKNNSIVGGAYAESLLQVCSGGGQPFSVRTPGYEARVNSGAGATLWLENSASSANSILCGTPAGVAGDSNRDPLVTVGSNPPAYTFNVTSQKWVGKRTADSFDRMQIDWTNSKILFGDGTIAPAIGWGALGNFHSIEGATTQTTAPAVGAASALPAQPAGYVTVFINGTNRKIAYY